MVSHSAVSINIAPAEWKVMEVIWKHLKERLTRIMQATTGASRAWKLGVSLFWALGATTLTRSTVSSEEIDQGTQPAHSANVLSGAAAIHPHSSPSPDKNTPANLPIKTIKERVRERFEQDRQTYTPEQLKEIEALYQTANKQWQSPEAKSALKVLIEKYPKANRTGCAILYLGQMTSGQEQENYLKKAIEKYGNCFYGNGVQVGAYARLYLADYYLKGTSGNLGAPAAKDFRAIFRRISGRYFQIPA
jgi:hypothetical protein